RRCGLGERALLEEGGTEDERGAPDLVDVVDASVEKVERLTSLVLGLLDAAGAQVDLRERRDRPTGVGIPTEVERDGERLLEQLHCLVGVAEQEVQPAEVVRELADMDAMGKLRIGLTGALGVIARQHPVALAVCDERRLEEGGADRAEIFDPLRKLERALDVVPRSFEVTLALPAARAPREDVGLERVAGQT